MAFVTSLSAAANTSFDELLANEVLLRNQNRGASEPASKVAGEMWLDASASAEIMNDYYDADGAGEAWYERGSQQHGDLTFLGTNGGQLVNAKFEQIGADETPGAGNIGQTGQLTTTREFRAVKNATTLTTLLSVDDGAFLSKELPLESWTLGGTAPAAATKGTTPAVPGLRFTTTSQKITRLVRIPAKYNGTADCKLRLYFALNLAESAGDDINITVNYEARLAAAAFGGVSTAKTGTTDIGSDTADGTVKVVDVTLTYNDADNPLAALGFLAVEVTLTNTTTIADVLFLGGEFLYPPIGAPQET
jgi:hypothetical protein